MYVYVCVCVYIYIYIYIYTHICRYVHMHVCKYVGTYVCTYTHISEFDQMANKIFYFHNSENLAWGLLDYETVQSCFNSSFINVHT